MSKYEEGVEIDASEAVPVTNGDENGENGFANSSDENSSSSDMEEIQLNKGGGGGGGGVLLDDDLRYSEHAFPRTDNGNADGKKSIFVRYAESMARKPCTHLLAALAVSITLAVLGLFVGNFEVAVDNAGWNSRGTKIADRHTQYMMINENKEALFVDEDGDYWDELQNNVQEGWESDDDEDRRRLTNEEGNEAKEATVEESVSLSPPLAAVVGPLAYSRYQSHHHHPAHRNLDSDDTEIILGPDECRTNWYGSPIMLEGDNVFSVWKTEPSKSSSSKSALDSDVLLEICNAETNSQNEIESRGLCFGCPDGSCLKPYSLPLMVRTYMDDETLTCQQMIDKWPSVKDEFTQDLATCVEDIKKNYNPEQGLHSNITSCPQQFVPTVVDENFGANNLVVRYTSSYFATGVLNVDGVYDIVDKLDRADGKLVKGAYETTDESFSETYVNDALTKDMALAMGSAVITMICIFIHTRSIWLTLMGLLQIALSFPLAYFFYVFIARLEFFPFLNFIGVFVVFALGADDVFVAVDKWKNARLELQNGTTEGVAALALPDAAYAMLLTTTTTAVAFFGTAVCPVAPILCFAVFCGLLIVFDYIMNIFLVFPALCLYDKWLTNGNFKWYLVCGKKNTAVYRERNTDDNDGDEKQSLIRRILGGYYHYLHILRWPLLLACIAAFIVCAIIAVQLGLPTSSDVRLLDDSNQFELNYQWRQNLLSEVLRKQGGSEAYVIWGVRPADTGNHNNPDTWSTLELDEEFSPSSKEAQTYLVQFCDRFYDTDFASRPFSEYKCPINVFDDWLQNQTNATDPMDEYTDNCNGATSVPVAEEDFDACIIAWSKLVSEYTVLAERGVVRVLFISSLSKARYDSPYDTLDEEWHKFEDWLDDERKNAAPSGVNNMYHTSEDFWWYDTNGAMLNTAYTAAAIALACAACVVFISSRSLVLTIFSVAAIAYVLVAATACLVGLGWELGFLESICFAILIGISCDFVIHFGHAYALFPGQRSRHYRTKFALIHMGPSILAAAATTLMAAIIMLFTEIVFFQKFAVILFMTIVHSTVGSFVIFLVLADCIGPTEPTKLVDTLCFKCHSWFGKHCCNKDNDKNDGFIEEPTKETTTQENTETARSGSDEVTA